MTSDPEFEKEFYENQNDLMIERYKVIFKKNKLNWKKYFSHIKKQLRNNPYWIWIFLCGIEKFISENKNISCVTEKQLFENANQRVAIIIGNHFRIQKYLDSI